MDHGLLRRRFSDHREDHHHRHPAAVFPGDTICLAIAPKVVCAFGSRLLRGSGGPWSHEDGLHKVMSAPPPRRSASSILTAAAGVPGGVGTQGEGQQDSQVSNRPLLVPPVPQPAGGELRPHRVSGVRAAVAMFIVLIFFLLFWAVSVRVRGCAALVIDFVAVVVDLVLRAAAHASPT